MRVVYHATRDRFFQSIRKGGLCSKGRKSYQGQVGEGLIYFALDDDCAASYVECADNIPESWGDDNIIVLAVPVNMLSQKYVYKDPNIAVENNTSTIAYGLPVPPEHIGILNYKEHKVEPIVQVKRLSNKYYY